MVKVHTLTDGQTDAHPNTCLRLDVVGSCTSHAERGLEHECGGPLSSQATACKGTTQTGLNEHCRRTRLQILCACITHQRTRSQHRRCMLQTQYSKPLTGTRILLSYNNTFTRGRRLQRNGNAQTRSIPHPCITYTCTPYIHTPASIARTFLRQPHPHNSL